QYLGETPEMTAEQLLGRKTEAQRKVLTVAPDSPVQEAIRIMKETEISQLPVVNEEGEIRGSIREDQVIDILVHGRELNDLAVEEVMDEPFPRVEAGASALEIQGLLAAGNPAVLVGTGNGDLGILTKFDLLQSLVG
ncbi:MAG: CBS domain-containing protein, partial [Planctomycetota bacterium]